MKRLTCIDLFCGCGGFSLGLERAGISVLAAIDFNEEAISVFRKNLSTVKHVLHQDLTKFRPDDLAKLLQDETVDIVVGGPPCQGFSTVRQRDGSNHGPRMVEDDRRHLYQEFFRYVRHFQPKVFVMENVLGIKSAANGRYFTLVQKEAREAGYRVHPQVEKAFELGVPQKRQRQLIIGTRLDLPNYFPSELKRAPRAVKSPTLGEAIGDLPRIGAGMGKEEQDYDQDLRRKHIKKYGTKFLTDTLEVQRAPKLTAHRARPHSARDLRDFSRLKEGEHCAEAMKRGETFEFPYDRSSFKDRYTRQHRKELCSTIVAHLSKDGLMFIHPQQNRSLTPREAARVQSFPDWFEFPIARTHQFRVIGNAVPPLVAESVGLAVTKYIGEVEEQSLTNLSRLHPLPKSTKEAVSWLLPLVHAADSKELKQISLTDFKRGWYSVGFLYTGLHPDSALEHGTEISQVSGSLPAVCKNEPQLVAPYYVQSGWPVALAPVVREAWRRYENNKLKDEEFYCSDAVIAGLSHCRIDDNDKYGKQTVSNTATTRSRT